MLEDFMGNMAGNELAEVPLLGSFFTSDTTLAREAQVAAAKEAAQAYANYRPEYQKNQQAALANLAGLMGPLNQMVQGNTGQSLDLQAGLNPAVSQAALGVGPQPGVYQPDKKPDATGVEKGGMTLIATGDPILAGGAWAGDALGLW